MRGFNRTLTIDAPPTEVFGVLTDLARAPQWMPAIQSTRWVVGDKVAPGAQWEEVRRNGKRSVRADIKVVRFVKDRTLNLRVDARPFGMDLGFDLFPVGAATKVDYHCHGRGKRLMSFFTRPIMRQVERQDDDLLHRLQAQVERTRP
ncbi:MAG TPA: SRPBCC family protein [Candidatus Thermoplasmatota archaeon]|nr:SRPBCC family protein [Candidatus Thermoplasmatota archaeon]